mgnify:CR=1 FL=1
MWTNNGDNSSISEWQNVYYKMEAGFHLNPQHNQSIEEAAINFGMQYYQCHSNQGIIHSSVSMRVILTKDL